MTKKRIRELARKHARSALENRADGWLEYESDELVRTISQDDLYAVSAAIFKYAPKDKRDK